MKKSNFIHLLALGPFWFYLTASMLTFGIAPNLHGIIHKTTSGIAFLIYGLLSLLLITCVVVATMVKTIFERMSLHTILTLYDPHKKVGPKERLFDLRKSREAKDRARKLAIPKLIFPTVIFCTIAFLTGKVFFESGRLGNSDSWDFFWKYEPHPPLVCLTLILPIWKFVLIPLARRFYFS